MVETPSTMLPLGRTAPELQETELLLAELRP